MITLAGPESTLLVVEDEPDDRFLIERALRKARIANPVRMAVDGDQAVAYLSGAGEFGDREAHPLPILVLLDLKLPRRSGFQVLEWIRETPAFRQLPVVVLTSSADDDDVRRAYARGANSYLVKPVEFSALHRMIETLGLYWLMMNRPPPPAGDQ